MVLNVYYEKKTHLWVAAVADEVGQLGDAEYGVTREEAAFRLGAELGRNPQKFAREIGEYFKG